MKRIELEESPYLWDDRLTIDCVAVITLVHDVKSLADELPPPSDIAEHLGRLLQEKERTDVVFLVEGEALISCTQHGARDAVSGLQSGALWRDA
jgi:speckle-type POZ protein